VTEILWKRNRTSLSPPEIWEILRPIGLSLSESPMSKILHKQTWNSAVQATRWKADTKRTFFFSSQIGRESNVVYQAATARPPRRQLSAGVIGQKIRRAQPTGTNWRWAVQHQLQQHDLVVENVRNVEITSRALHMSSAIWVASCRILYGYQARGGRADPVDDTNV